MLLPDDQFSVNCKKNSIRKTADKERDKSIKYHQLDNEHFFLYTTRDLIIRYRINLFQTLVELIYHYFQVTIVLVHRW